MDPNVFKKRGQYYYEQQVGESIYAAMPKAIHAAKRMGVPVTVLFNEVSLVVSGSDDPKEAAKNCLERQSSQWDRNKSPEAAAAFKASNAYETALDQQALDTLVNAGLGAAITEGAGAVVNWFKDYVGLAWSKGVEGRAPEVSAMLAGAGYKPQENANDKERYSDKSVFASYVVGYALKEMQKGYAPYRPVFLQVCDEFDAVKRSKSIPVMRPLALKKGAPA